MQPMLPKDECVVLSKLSGVNLRARVFALHEAGWTLAEIAAAFNPPKSRSTIHTWARTPPSPSDPRSMLPLPLPSKSLAAAEKSTSATGANASKPKRERRSFDSTSPQIPTDMRKRIEELAPLARRYRARANPSGAYALANDELTVLCRSLYNAGVSVRELSLTAGVTYRAMARRVGK